MDLRGLLVRKIFHITGAILLAVPFISNVPIAPYYSLLALAAGVFYSVQVKMPKLLVNLRLNIFKNLEEMFINLDKLVPVSRVDLKIQYDAALAAIERALESAERDYEKRGGYLGLLMGAVGILISYNVFGPSYLLPAVLGLAVYDTFSALVGAAVGRHRLPATEATIEGAIGGGAPTFLALAIAGYSPLAALLILAAIVLAEAYGVEDNLAIPLAASAAAYLAVFI
ncbi:MAG: phosphatidate cytidylyltransferase [Thermoproteus sp.]|nr:phosphatidate cytidylyltransferase [Thermoproteus sp.]